MHLKVTEGIDTNNWDKYNSLCLQCFQEKFNLHTQHCIGFKNSKLGETKDYHSKYNHGDKLLVQNVSTTHFEVDCDQFYTDVKNKDQKDQDFCEQYLWNNYYYTVKKKNTGDKFRHETQKPAEAGVEEAETIFHNNDDVAGSHLKYCD
eukprot:3415199-Ditylum_brightwellii.AAC.1